VTDRGIAVTTRRTAEVEGAAVDPQALAAAGVPVILRGAVRDWPLVRAGMDAPHAALARLATLDDGHQVTRYVAPAEAHGRFFYNEALTGFNFTAERVSLARHLADVEAEAASPAPRALYVGSTDIDQFLPRLRGENDLHADFGGGDPTVSIWIGNRTVAATHYDASDNLACCVLGRRRFTLFPPDQAANLYPGPLAPTPGGQVVSMVDPAAPDLGRHPRFAAALAAAQVAELEPGDVLFYPALWWHQVEALDDANVMINYWWSRSAPWSDPPMAALLHAMLSLRDRPAAEKASWRALFDHYVFGDPRATCDHLPPHARGALAPLDEVGARRLRAEIAERLNR
jgi:hypothetical protein